MKRDYKEIYKDIWGHPERLDNSLYDNLLNDLIADRPNDDISNMFRFVFNDAKMLNKFGYIDYCRTLENDYIVGLCKKFAVYEFWARCFLQCDWRVDRILWTDNCIIEDENAITAVMCSLKEISTIINRVFTYYHDKAKPKYDMQTLAANTLNDERADERVAGGVQAAEPQPTPTPAALNLPDELATERAKKYFGRAVEKGYMTVAGKGATWNKSQVELAFVCYLIYENSRPINTLELYFGKRSLAASIAQAANAYDLYQSKNDTQTLKVKTWIKTVLQDIFFE